MPLPVPHYMILEKIKPADPHAPERIFALAEDIQTLLQAAEKKDLLKKRRIDNWRNFWQGFALGFSGPLLAFNTPAAFPALPEEPPVTQSYNRALWRTGHCLRVAMLEDMADHGMTAQSVGLDADEQADLNCYADPSVHGTPLLDVVRKQRHATRAQRHAAPAPL